MRQFVPAFCFSVLAVANTTTLSLGQSPKTAASTDVKLTAFAIPPFPTELLGLSPNQGGGVRLQTAMPISGRVGATTDEAKLRGAQAPPAGVYLYSAAIDGQGQPTATPGVVYGPIDSRLKLGPDTPIDWAVWGTTAQDGPLRLPYGGGLDRLPAALQSQPQVRRMRLAVNIKTGSSAWVLAVPFFDNGLGETSDQLAATVKEKVLCTPKQTTPGYVSFFVSRVSKLTT